jgi:hypothetical protein
VLDPNHRHPQYLPPRGHLVVASMWDVFVDQVHLSAGAVPDVQMAQPLNNLKNVSVDSRRNSRFRYTKVEAGMLLAPNRH